MVCIMCICVFLNISNPEVTFSVTCILSLFTRLGRTGSCLFTKNVRLHPKILPPAHLLPLKGLLQRLTHTMTSTQDSPEAIDLLESSNTTANTTSDIAATTVIKTEEEIVTDEQIDDLLREVEEIRQTSPIKAPKVVDKDDDSDASTVNSSVMSPKADSSVGSVKEEETPALSTKTSSTHIPKSVSQALFSSSIKVTKTREKEPIKFLSKGKHENATQKKKIAELQRRDQEVSVKIKKLNREINYLKELIESAGISSDLSELRKLNYAIERLQDYLDQKQKEKYEVGMLLTRAMRKRIDSGESGEFWVN